MHVVACSIPTKVMNCVLELDTLSIFLNTALFAFVLFDLILYVPVNNFSVSLGRAFLG